MSYILRKKAKYLKLKHVDKGEIVLTDIRKWKKNIADGEKNGAIKLKLLRPLFIIALLLLLFFKNLATEKKTILLFIQQ